MEKLGIFAIFLLLHTNGYLCEDNPCRYDLDKNYRVDLSTLKSHQFVTYTFKNQIYVFSICQDSLKLPAQFPVDASNPCTKEGGFSLCLYNNTSPVNSIKLAKTTDWKWTESEGHIFLTASSDSSQLRIELSCLTTSHEATSTFFVATPPENQTEGTVKDFHLFSPLACPQKIHNHHVLSIGSILLITLLVAFVIYLTIGIVVNSFLLGARGIEVMPNIRFWRNLPGLVIDGAKFLQNGCKVRPNDLVQGRDTYDAYDSI